MKKHFLTVIENGTVVETRAFKELYEATLARRRKLSDMGYSPRFICKTARNACVEVYHDGKDVALKIK